MQAIGDSDYGRRAYALRLPKSKRPRCQICNQPLSVEALVAKAEQCFFHKATEKPRGHVQNELTPVVMAGRIKKRLQETGVMQADLARYAGFSPKAFSYRLTDKTLDRELYELCKEALRKDGPLYGLWRIDGTFLRHLREKKSLTRKEVAEAAGISDSTLREYEVGKLGVKREMYERIARELG